ncbi:MAG: hypothetical protein LBS38_00255 [Endomicrobium sp.]|jgi:hypothetical protein|nr:hypothetical protein [Endomicrobium sp.]
MVVNPLKPILTDENSNNKKNRRNLDFSDKKVKKVFDLIEKRKYIDVGRFLVNGDVADKNDMIGVDIDDMLGPDALDLAQESCAYLGLPMPETLQDSTSKLGRMMLSCLNRTVAYVTMQYDWNQLKFTGIVTTTPVPPLYNPLIDGYYLKLIAPGYASFESSLRYIRSSDKVVILQHR